MPFEYPLIRENK